MYLVDDSKQVFYRNNKHVIYWKPTLKNADLHILNKHVQNNITRMQFFVFEVYFTHSF